jgi:antitoxin (DNA-binding transcriptional repressor) of toxin-antitoxin stability system
MPAVNMLDAKANLSRLVESLEKGTEREYIIARHGRPAGEFGR